MNSHEPVYVALGKMLVAFQNMEASLKYGLILLFNYELGTASGQLADATISELSFASASRVANKIPTLFTVDRIAHSSLEGKKRLSEELEFCCERLVEGLKLGNEVEQRRNQLVHSTWFTSSGFVNKPNSLYRIKHNRKNLTQSSQFKSEAAKDIDECTIKALKASDLISSSLRDYKLISNHSW